MSYLTPPVPEGYLRRFPGVRELFRVFVTADWAWRCRGLGRGKREQGVIREKKQRPSAVEQPYSTGVCPFGYDTKIIEANPWKSGGFAL